MFLEQFQPHPDVLQRVLLGDIVHKDNALCIFEVCGDQASVSLLACCVPHLQAVNLAISANVFDIEVDAHRCLGYALLTLCVY